jgi:hypothetical protein
MITWKRVESPSELAPAMAVQVRPCGFCGREEKLTLLQPATTDESISLNGDGDFVGQGVTWKTAPGLCIHPRRPVDFSKAIHDGRLWRQAEEEPSVETMTTRVRERVK